MLRHSLNKTRVLGGMLLVGTLSALVTDVQSQILIAAPDTFTVPQGITLVVDAPGILDNDTVDDQGAGDLGATAELVTDALYGTLTLNSDGSFSYLVGTGFDGRDEFTYRMVAGGGSAQAAVILSACSRGPGLITCWKETEFTNRALELGLDGFREGFEDDAMWGGVRSPFSAPTVISQGIQWTTNHSGTPANNNISTTSGPPHSGLYAGFDPSHGYATGTPGECDIDNPPAHCLYHDGLSGTNAPGSAPMHGVGAWIDGTNGARVQISLDGGPLLGDVRTTFGHEFIGVIDPSPSGFNSFNILEADGKIGQPLYIFVDDVTVLTRPVSGVTEQQQSTRVFFAGAGPNPLSGNTTLRFSLAEPEDVRLAIYDQRGRLVRSMMDGHRSAGEYAVDWDGRDDKGQRNAAGLYFGRLEVGRGAQKIVQVKKMMVLQ